MTKMLEVRFKKITGVEEMADYLRTYIMNITPLYQFVFSVRCLY